MHLFFATPIWISEIDNFKNINKELLNYIGIEKSKNPGGLRKSNVKGWHSNEFDLKDENLKAFIMKFLKILELQ